MLNMSERTSNEMEKLSLQTRFPRDFLQRFTVGTRSDPEEEVGSGSGEEVELNLGLSLGGRFGVDKSCNDNNNKLIRSSSIAAIFPAVRDDDVLGSGHENNPGPGPGRSYSGLIRTSSLPVETEEEWRKRKELQSLRRLAAKRRRSEKQKGLTVADMGRVGSSTGPPLRSGKLPPSPSGGGGLSPEGSSMSEVESRHRKGSGGRGGETSSLLQESSRGMNPQPADGHIERESSAGRRNARGSMEDMPCVFTQGDGPNGRVVEGILYKYGKGEQVKIMCVCHGNFLSPAEFVRHAGGTDFLHPLKHIVVKPSSFS